MEPPHGQRAVIECTFDRMLVEVPKTTGPDAQQATWKLHGTRTTDSDNRDAVSGPVGLLRVGLWRVMTGPHVGGGPRPCTYGGRRGGDVAADLPLSIDTGDGRTTTGRLSGTGDRLRLQTGRSVSHALTDHRSAAAMVTDGPAAAGVGPP